MSRADKIRRKIQEVIDLREASNLQTNSYRVILKNILYRGGPDVEELMQVYVERMMGDDVNRIVSLRILTYFIVQILPGLSNEQTKSLGGAVMKQLLPKANYYLQQMACICQYLSKVYENENNFKEAAEVFISMGLDSELSLFPKHYKLEVYINVVGLYLRAGELQSAENCLRIATKYQSKVQSEKLKFSYKIICVQLLDYQKKYFEAAKQYYDLSTVATMPQEECFRLLQNSFECALLLPIGQPRFNMMSMLYKDRRCKNLEEFSMLEKFNLNRIIDPKDYLPIEAKLQPHHQNAKIVDGITSFHRAMLEYNIFCISKLYSKIFIDSLGNKLGVEKIIAERITGNMMSEDRLQGSIDQVDNLINFRIGRDKPENVMSKWSDKIGAVCSQVNHIVQLISEHPDTKAWYEKYQEKESGSSVPKSQ